ncbi:hypothetical protein D8674_010051 [Pyrus ussuriensis x Pyrus communis]|uniref:Uncharacterized protein n=1 Tax=Pyrus ussuriensis x Pyrus communis TaxID=2448454 RepID=A0A5N5FF15_9ROSA|nr:hypothetical protein D8674_010051 [Pyrus ussuriensis x Pyrus communis]
MGLVNINALAVLLLLLCLAHVQPNEASRILYAKKREELSLQSLQRGQLPPDESSKCTYIPGTGGSGCPLKVKNYAGHGLPHHHASANPRLMVRFGVAANIPK